MLIELLKNIRLDAVTKRYNVTEAGFKYGFDESMLINLRTFFDNDRTRLISDWYASLPATEKAKVSRVSAYA